MIYVNLAWALISSSSPICITSSNKLSFLCGKRWKNYILAVESEFITITHLNSSGFTRQFWINFINIVGKPSKSVFKSWLSFSCLYKKESNLYILKIKGKNWRKKQRESYLLNNILEKEIIFTLNLKAN